MSWRSRLHTRIDETLKRLRPHLTPLRIGLGALLAGWIATGVVIWIWIFQSGLISVRVESESLPGGRLEVSVPGAIARAALPLVPEHIWREAAAKGRDWLPVTRAVVEELAQSPDFVLVSVRTPEERVHIAKRGRHLEIQVGDPAVEIRCQVPLGTLKVCLARMKRLGSSSCASRGI